VSYTDNFSTGFRAALGAEISAPVQCSDLVGEDPLPDRLAHATVRFRKTKEASGVEVTERVPTKAGVRTDEELKSDVLGANMSWGNEVLRNNIRMTV
jgi:hypothetical protein